MVREAAVFKVKAFQQNGTEEASRKPPEMYKMHIMVVCVKYVCSVFITSLLERILDKLRMLPRRHLNMLECF